MVFGGSFFLRLRRRRRRVCIIIITRIIIFLHLAYVRTGIYNYYFYVF